MPKNYEQAKNNHASPGWNSDKQTNYYEEFNKYIWDSTARYMHDRQIKDLLKLASWAGYRALEEQASSSRSRTLYWQFEAETAKKLRTVQPHPEVTGSYKTEKSM